MAKKVSYEAAVKMFELRDGFLYWLLPTKGRRKQGSRAGNINKVSGKILIEIQGKNYHANHLVWLLTHKKHPDYKLEYINGDKLNNRIENLREIIPRSIEATPELVRRLFDYRDGKLFWKAKLSVRSHIKIGSIAGHISTQKNNEYRYIRVGGKRCKAADLIWMHQKGEKPKSMLDHINHAKSDDRIENLREVTQKENLRNQPLRKTNTSGVTGVIRNSGKWLAKIGGVHLGMYKEFKDAVIARKAAEVVFGYHENHGKKDIN